MKTSVLALPLLAATAARAVPLPAPTFGGAAMWDPMFWMKKWGNMLGGDAGLSGMGDLSKWANGLGEISKWIKYAHDTLRSTDGSTGTSTSTGSGGGSGLAALEKIASQVMVLVALNMHTTLTQAMLHPSAYMTGSKGSGADSTANTAGESTGSTSGASNSARLIRGLNTTPPTGGSSGTTVSKAVVSGSTPATEAQRASKANALARDKVSVQGRTQKAALNKTTTPTVPTTGTTV
ncbi:BQ5605_C028g10502 [Microbotryum silenes-dioicae]|uniref:BQ5605_C028g10502 protein n=1 Tax=Microbotryum silenes-dioicae TaxID=796604 RepID=A0A2X0MIQ4_9BASI|nr:BQ5605_C028g10502 [Microbotryum silenes-dioicae]